MTEQEQLGKTLLEFRPLFPQLAFHELADKVNELSMLPMPHKNGKSVNVSVNGLNSK